MRITHIRIDRWRCFEDLDIPFPAEAPLICLVGENGTGKSSILELIRFALSTAGLSGSSTGVASIPQNIFAAGDRARVDVDLRGTDREILVQRVLGSAPFPKHLSVDDVRSSIEGWDGYLEIELGGATRVQQTRPSEDIDERQAGVLSQILEIAVRNQQGRPDGDLDRYLFLGPDRWALQPIPGSDAEPADIYRYQSLIDVRDLVRDWFARRRDPYLRELSEWERQFVAAHRQKTTAPEEPESPVPDVPLLSELLPYLHPLPIEVSENDVPQEAMFQSRGRKVPFSALSSGEKDIVTMAVAQSELSPGHSVVLFDEPELHINPDLVRKRLGVIKRLASATQIIVATHSYEAVEQAGETNTFILRRSSAKDPVTRAERWGDDPVFSSLASSLGMPAFSLSRDRFVFVEGDASEAAVTRRFDALAGNQPENWFIKMGGCSDVRSQLSKLSDRWLSSDRHQRLWLGAVIDRDFHTEEQAEAFEAAGNIHVLTCHEEENIFLHPPSMRALLRQSKIDRDYDDLLREIADQDAAYWVIERAKHLRRTAVENVRPAVLPAERRTALATTTMVDNWIDELLAAQTKPIINRVDASEALRESVLDYQRLRSGPDLWLQCRGKEVFAKVCKVLDLDEREVEDALSRQWNKDEHLLPDPAIALREWLTQDPHGG